MELITLYIYQELSKLEEVIDLYFKALEGNINNDVSDYFLEQSIDILYELGIRNHLGYDPIAIDELKDKTVSELHEILKIHWKDKYVN